MADMEMNVPDGWHRKQVAGFALKMRSGGTPKSDNPSYYNGEIPFVSIEDLTSANKYLDKTQKHITKAGLDNSSAWLVPENTLLYSIYATLGVPRITLIEAATNQAILGIIPDSKQIDLEFLFYLLLEKRRTILAHSSHTTQSNLNAKIVKELEFVFPDSLTEQRQITSILSKVDEAISQTEQLIAKYRRLKMGLMQDLLTKGIDEHGSIRSEETHAFKNSSLGRIPAEWEVVETGELFEMTLGKMLNREAKNGKDTFPYLGNKSVQWGRIDLTELQEMSFNEAEREKFSLRKGDLLVCEGGEAGRCAIWQEDDAPIYFQKAIHRLRVNSPKIITRYMHEYMVSIVEKSFFNDFVSQTSIKHFTQEKFKKLPILLPPVDEQRKICKASKSQDIQLDKEIQTLVKFQSLKIGLMQDLLSGKVRVEQLIRETAAV